MKLSKGRIRHLHKTKQQSRRNRAKTNEVHKRYNLSYKNKTPVNIRSLTLKYGLKKGQKKRHKIQKKLDVFASKLNRRFHIYGGENGDTKTDEEKRLAEDKEAKEKAAKDNEAKDKVAKDKET